ncbi:TPA_asm: hypothetical protein [ssRNA phage SRR7976325_14]|uniref:Uncharacterized protein n=1 Tax=ssRNA phage SRR7976325_14 TaxID=2786701 RepID=A0A8S5L5X2_9VIRU|nr:hypothetical protein QIL96_gp1 [ssRNA phage SRR7976325_14]DAD52770.1 TPA_asm: hypothetical protein [ssRNA phage SRR7976325_14]
MIYIHHLPVVITVNPAKQLKVGKVPKGFRKIAEIVQRDVEDIVRLAHLIESEVSRDDIYLSSWTSAELRVALDFLTWYTETSSREAFFVLDTNGDYSVVFLKR